MYEEGHQLYSQVFEEGIFDEVDADTAAEIVDMVATEEFDLDWDGSVKLL